MLVLLVLVLFYTIMGGMISVVIADYVQFVILSFGLLLATGLAIVKLGWGNIFTSMIELKGEAGFNPFMAESFVRGRVCRLDDVPRPRRLRALADLRRAGAGVEERGRG